MDESQYQINRTVLFCYSGK